MLTHTMLYLLVLNDDKDAVMNVDKAKKRIAKLVKKVSRAILKCRWSTLVKRLILRQKLL